MPTPESQNPNFIPRSLAAEWLIVLVLTLIAAFLRFYQLDLIPAEFHLDEWVEVYDAQAIKAEGPRLFSTTNHGREPLFTHLLALTLFLFEAQDFVPRAIGALAGTLAIPASYLVTREMFRQVRPTQFRWLATLTALGMVTSYWQIHHTRIGIRHTLLPLLIPLLVYFLWRGLNTGRRAGFIGAGLLLGLCLYVYPAARLLPIMIAGFFVAEALVRRLSRPALPALWRQHWPNLLLLFGLAFLIFAPLGYFFLVVGPEFFTRRASMVAISNPAFSQVSTVQAFAQNVVANFGGLAFYGDEFPILNLPGRPIFGPLMAIAFVVGVLIALLHLRQPAYLFILVWWLVMMGPSFFVQDWVPSFKRAIGIVPALYIFPALTWLALGNLLLRWGKRRQVKRPGFLKATAVVVPLLVYTSVGLISYRDYFLIWAPSHPFYEDVLLHRDLAEKIVEEGRPDELWVFPTDPRNVVRRYYRLAGTFGRDDLPPVQFITVDEQAMFDELAAAAKGYDRIVLADIKSGQEWEADAKHIFPFLLEKYGALEETYISPDYDYELQYYRLDTSAAALQPAVDWQPQNVSFGENLELTAAAYGDASGQHAPQSAQVPSGETAWVALRWQAAGPLPEDYQASLRLTSPGGHIASQIDGLLTNVRHRGTSRWEPGETVQSYYLLPIEPGAVPGDYQLHVLVYSSADFASLPAITSEGRSITAEVGTIAVTPALAPPELNPEHPLQLGWGSELQLAGHGALPASLRPGDTFTVELFWQSQASLARDARLALLLVGQETSRPLLAGALVGGESFPTSTWRAGEAIRQPLQVQLPPDVLAGSYTLIATAPEANSAVALGQLQVEGRPRLFEAPAGIQYPLDRLLGERVRLLGLDLDAPAAGKMTVTLYWQPRESLAEDYKGFVHILDENGQIIAQQDQIPQAGQAPTTGWLPGEVIADTYTFSLPAGAVPAGSFQLAVGLYNEETGQRLAVPGNPDNLVLLSDSISMGK